MEYEPQFEPENVEEAREFLKREVKQPQWTRLWNLVAESIEGKLEVSKVDALMRKSAKGLLNQLA